uniref:Major sperm protein n=1 Tax=Strongyloides stercoralis TaxID=6248 RepID=A0A0K0DZB2_STRER
MKEFPLEINLKKGVTFAPSGNASENFVVELKLKNTTKDKQAVKVKCTSNELFKIAPPVSIIKPGDSLTVTLTYNGNKPYPDDNKHYFVIYSLLTTTDEAPRKLFSNDKDKKAESTRLFAFFKKGDDDNKDSKNEEKKDEKNEKEDKNGDKKNEENKDEKKEDKKEDKKEEKK